MVVKGKIIGVTDYNDSNAPWRYKLFKLVIEKKYKAVLSMPDTVSIITGQDGGSCGYAFKIGKEYIVYGRIHKQINTLSDDSENKPIEDNSHTLFETDICTSTKETNRQELTALKRLTK